MKKNLLAFMMLALGLSISAQSPRVTLYEEFTGETCPPCASTNPGLNTLLLSAVNATRIIAIKWQVPIPSAPTKTWSLYQTNKPEIDWRYRSVANGGYGYIPIINSAPSSKIDGRPATDFGASSGHPANLNNTVISNAVSQASSFNIIMTRDPITPTSTAAVVSVTIQATTPYSTTSNLVFRNVLVERLIQFSVQPGTNGETKFEDAARRSYPTIQNGTALPKVWTQGQTQTFTMNCVFPSSIRDNMEIEFVGFIQNDGTQRVEQVTRTDMPHLSFDAAAASVSMPFLCSVANTMAPTVPVKNDGQTDITALTITPYVDGVAKAPTTWTGLIPPGYSDFVQLNAFTAATTAGVHTFSYTISGLNGTDANMANNGASGTFYGVSNAYQSAPIAEPFTTSGWPYAKWLVTNTDNGAGTWAYAVGVEAYAIGSGNSLKYGFFKNTVINDKDEVMLPPLDLTGVGVPVMTFDLAYILKEAGSDDKLELMASTDCGANWTSVWSASGMGLSANPVVDPTEYNTTQPGDWLPMSVPFYGYNQANVLVKFVAHNKNGNNLYIDNINLASSNIPDGLAENNAGKLNVLVYPNPNNGLTNVSLTSRTSQEVKLSVVNAIGQVVLVKPVSLSVGKNTTSVDLSSFATGIYLINVEGENVKTTSRVSVNR